MAHEETIEIRDDPPGAAPSLGFGDILKYWDLIQKIISIWQALSIDVGAKVALGWTRIKFRGGRYRWDLGSITRES